ncbi:MAG: hypothetical protein JNK85_09175 [Verrucomicrobiales bacterium]|nr:hypothetical protein [Verrucomicrobiales bacterium]
MNTRWIRRLIWLTGWMSLAALAQSAIDPNTGEVKPDAAASKARVASFVEEVSLGKMAEEGQGHIGHAMAYYSNAIRDFDSIRRPVAEALHHYAGLMIGSNTPRVGVEAFRRILREFSDFKDLVDSSRARLRDHGLDEPDSVTSDPAGSVVAGAASGPVAMDPVLAERYGLVGTRDAVFSRRYGQGYGGGPGGEGMAPAGGLGSDAANPIPSSGIRSPANEEVGGSRNPAADLVEEMAASMRAELIQLSSQLRRVQREQRAAQTDNLDKFPESLIEDSTLMRILSDLQKAREDIAINAKAEDISKRERRLLVQQELALRYLKETYRPRLEVTEALLSKEIDQLRRQISELESESKALRKQDASR